jgi:hypothetical protein
MDRPSTEELQMVYGFSSTYGVDYMLLRLSRLGARGEEERARRKAAYDDWLDQGASPQLRRADMTVAQVERCVELLHRR